MTAPDFIKAGPWNGKIFAGQWHVDGQGDTTPYIRDDPEALVQSAHVQALIAAPMSRLDALRALKKGVEDGAYDVDRPQPDFVNDWRLAIGPEPVHMINGWGAYNDDLNAARRLHDAVRPGCPAQLDTAGFVRLVRVEADFTRSFTAFVRGKPARAWLLAVIASLIEEEEGK